MWLSNSSIGRKVVMSVTGIACVNFWELTGMPCWAHLR